MLEDPIYSEMFTLTSLAVFNMLYSHEALLL